MFIGYSSLQWYWDTSCLVFAQAGNDGFGKSNLTQRQEIGKTIRVKKNYEIKITFLKIISGFYQDEMYFIEYLLKIKH